MSEAVFKIVVVEQVTERVWYEVVGVETVKKAIAAYQQGEGLETHRKHLSTDQAGVEETYQEGQDAV